MKGVNMKLRVLSQNDVRRAISMAQAIEIVKKAFAQLSAGEAVVPIRTQLEVARHEGITLFMPAYLQESDDLGVKIVSVFPRNLEVGLLTIHALVAVVDAETGRPAAVMDGTYLTALRTGAASGAATDLLARTDARMAAVFGAGVQGRTQLEAVCQVRDIEKAWVYDVNREAAEKYAEEMRGRGGRFPGDVSVAASPTETVREADVICTATTAMSPVFADADLKAGVHINAIGAFTPEMQEVPEQTIKRARLVVDSREACWAEAGDLIIPRHKGLISEDDIYAELGEIVARTKRGRESDEEITFFKSVGNAVQDVSVARKVLEEAGRLGLGLEVEL
jgi:ornithine cyclodeaminase